MHPWMDGIQVYSDEGPAIFQGGDKITKNRNYNIQVSSNLLLQNHWANSNQAQSILIKRELKGLQKESINSRKEDNWFFFSESRYNHSCSQMCLMAEILPIRQ